MSSRTLRSAGILLPLFTAVLVLGQLWYKTSMNVPFEFTAGDTRFPAGPCNLERVLSSSGSFKLKITAGRAFGLVNTVPMKPMPGDQPGRNELIFHRYGDQRFLSEVWIASSGVQLPKSAAERKLEKSGVAMELVTVKR